MNRTESRGVAWGMRSCVPAWAAAAWLALVTLGGQIGWTQRPSTDSHVPELAAYFDRVEIAEPVVYRHLAVYPILVSDDVKLRGKWLTLDAALSRGVLEVTEKGAGGSVPTVVVHNRSRDEHVLLMGGELLSGGKQGRTVRRDVILAPGQRIELDVFCVEARRWEGSERFSTAGALVPQSIQIEIRRGADQQRVWSEVARNNRALAAENPTGSLELALKAKPVQDQLGEVRRHLIPRMPTGTVGFLFLNYGRPLGGEFFGNADMASRLLPKLLDSYAIDCIVLSKPAPGVERPDSNTAAIELFQRIARAGSERSHTPGSGAGIRTYADGLVGEGVSLGGQLVHYGVQSQPHIVPLPQ